MDKPHWRSAYGPDEVIRRVRLTESFDWLPNPHRGTTTFQRMNGAPLFPGLTWDDSNGPLEFAPFDGDPLALRNDRYPRTTISYCRWLWSVIEPEKGRFRWDVIDGSLAAARARGQTLQIRTQPYIGDQVPAWFLAAGGRMLPDGRNVDHNTPEYVEHWGDHIRAWGARYDGHPDLESFDVAYGGPCGETGGNATAETARKLVDVYMESFRRTQLVSMLGTDGCAYAAGVGGRDIGWRADCLGDVRTDGQGVVPENANWNHMHDAYPKEVAQCGVADAWRRAPVTLETCWTVGYWRKQGWDVDWILEQALKYHPSVFMPKSSFIPDDVRERVDAFDRRLGYRFVPRQVVLPMDARRGARFEFTLWVDNVGVAPIYRPYELALRFRQGARCFLARSKADLRAWMPDHTWLAEELALPEGLEPGDAEVDVGIVRPGTDRAAVRFAVREVRDDGWHPLGYVNVV